MMASAMIDQADERAPQEAEMVLRGGHGPVRFQTHDGQSIDLSNFYQGRSVFLVLSGPSLADSNHELLRSPGVVTWAVNNAISTFRTPRLWTVVDPVSKFHDRFWRDPSILKLMPLANANQKLRLKTPEGKWALSQWRAREMPSIFFWHRNSEFEPADFLTEPSVCWGNDEKQTDSVGVTGVRSVMLATIKLAYSVGFRTVYLVGADFRMEVGKQNYAFKEDRDRFACNHNNQLYAALNKRFESLAPYFGAEGFHVYNCTPGSGLTAFLFKRLSDAVAAATRDCGGPVDCQGWYAGPPKDEFAIYRDGGGD